MSESLLKPKLIDGGSAIDDRGVLGYVGQLPPEFLKVRRFYVVENFDNETVRGFHGHLREEKLVYVVSGSAIVVLGAMNPDTTINDKIPPLRYILSARKPQMLHIPAGYVNGFRAIEPNTRILFFSTATAEESAKDDYRWSARWFGPEIWKAAWR